MSAARISRWSLIALVLAALIVSACAGTRRDFPSWRFKEAARVSEAPAGGQEDMPDVAANRFGQTVVVWSHGAGSAAELYWRRYNAVGQPLTPPIRLTTNAYGDYYPRIDYIMGTTYIVWMGDETTSSNIYWVAVNDAGAITAGPTMISDPARNDYDPRIIYCGESHVIWTGNTASTNFAIQYATVADSGTIDLTYRPISGFSNDERDAVGVISPNCGTLHVAYVYEVSLTNDDVLYTAVNTATGMNILTAGLGVSPSDENEPAIAVANEIGGVPRQVNIAWRFDDGAGGEIYYASRQPDGLPCTPSALPLTNDSVTDQSPAILGTGWAGAAYAYIAWARTGAGGYLDIVGTLFLDDCTPAPPPPVLVSNHPASVLQNDGDVQVIGSFAPDGVPIFATVWRGWSGGRVFARFGSISSTAPQIGNAERISPPGSEGYPAGLEVLPEVAVGGGGLARHLRVAWLGVDGTLARNIFFQQTAWQTTSPLILHNHTGDAPAPGNNETNSPLAYP
jgi:hypothetical protein